MAMKVFSSEKRALQFWIKVNKDGPEHQLLGRCWLWTGYCENKGYGRLMLNKRMVMAHRYSWELHNGPIPDEIKVLHKCDNPTCVNSTHLFLGSYADNNADRNEKNRQAKGESNGKSKMTEELVRELRELINRSAPGRSRLGKVCIEYGLIANFARVHGLHENTVRAAAHGKSWRHVQ